MVRTPRQNVKRPISFLPPIYEDELIHSFVARVKLLKMWTPTKTRATLFGTSHEAPMAVALPTRLADLSSCFEDQRVTAKKLAWQHTLLPFLTAFRPKNDRRAMLATMIGSGEVRGGATASQMFMPTRWRFCRLCNDRMLDQHGELYWRRAHQVGIATYCGDHDIPLQHSGVVFSSAPAYTVPTVKNCPSNAETVSEAVDVSDVDLLRILSKRACRLLEEVSLFNDHSAAVSDLRSTLISKGYGNQSGNIAWKKLENASKDTMMALKMPFPKLASGRPFDANGGWFSRLLVDRYPVRTDQFLIAEHITSSLKPWHTFGPGPWPCMNLISGHFGELKVKDILRLRQLGDRRRAWFACDCGYTYSRMQRADGSLTDPRFIRFGKTLAKAVAQARADGATIGETATSLGIGAHTLLNAMAREGISNHWTKIPEWVKQNSSERLRDEISKVKFS